MYLVKVSDNTHGFRYLIRQSVTDGHCFRSRDLFDLGQDPARFIVYPGGNGFYIDEAVEAAIARRAGSVSQEALEKIFLPFLDPSIRRVIDGFDRRGRHRRATGQCLPADTFHPFDRLRLHYLKLGRVDPRAMAGTPDRFYLPLQNKCRDEIEWDFIVAERILRPHEWVPYTCQIFDLPGEYRQRHPRNHPHAPDQGRMDRCFIDRLCTLDGDGGFWRGSDPETGLHRHLIRYVIMYFDGFLPLRDPFQELLEAFRNRHRLHRPPPSVQLNLAESAQLLGVSVEALRKMDGPALTRQYRKRAMIHHPDQGGDPDTFVRLGAAYGKLLKRKSRK